MNIRYLIRDVKIDERTKSYVEKRVAKIEKMLDRISQVEIKILLDKKGKFTTDVSIKTPYHVFRANETTESIEGSIDIVVEEIQQQIRKIKDRIKELKERGARSIKKKTVISKEARFRS